MPPAKIIKLLCINYSIILAPLSTLAEYAFFAPTLIKALEISSSLCFGAKTAILPPPPEPTIFAP
tara:strand:+ start:1033 stop:1227 length:195 start_codon:yes stop_codon:yes gene_type:complete